MELLQIVDGLLKISKEDSDSALEDRVLTRAFGEVS